MQNLVSKRALAPALFLGNGAALIGDDLFVIFGEAGNLGVVRAGINDKDYFVLPWCCQNHPPYGCSASSQSMKQEGVVFVNRKSEIVNRD